MAMSASTASVNMREKIKIDKEEEQKKQNKKLMRFEHNQNDLNSFRR